MIRGDHPGCQAVWLDERAIDVGPCTCGGLLVLRRERANYGPALPIHRHIIEVCPACDRWTVTCVAALDEARRGTQ